MQFEDIKSQIKTCNFNEVRADKPDFFEAVIQKNNLETLNAGLNSILGSPVWPAQGELPDETRHIVEPFGGIMSGQSLYLKRMDDFQVFAMLWPWGDKEHITIKMGRVAA